MARYFFDIHDGQSLMRDAVGSECESPRAIRKDAKSLLPEIAGRAIDRDDDREGYTVIARNEAGVTVYTATLTFSGAWLTEDPLPKPERLSP